MSIENSLTARNFPDPKVGKRTHCDGDNGIAAAGKYPFIQTFAAFKTILLNYWACFAIKYPGHPPHYD